MPNLWGSLLTRFLFILSIKKILLSSLLVPWTLGLFACTLAPGSWSLWTPACGLSPQLVACRLASLCLKACRLLLKFFVVTWVIPGKCHLVYFILNLFNILGPACTAAAAVVALFGGRADMTRARLRYHGGPMSPGVAGLRVILCIA